MIDTHAHLDELDNLETALVTAQEIGTRAIIAVGSNHQSNQKIIDICNKYPTFVFPALGIHPWELGNLEPSQLEYILKYIEQRISDIVAIGEIGLDYDKRVIRRASKELQKDVLKRLLSLALSYNKPVSIHSRYAWKDCFDIVRDSGIEKAVFHWFTGFSSVLRSILERGYFVSCTPAAEYHEEHRRAIKETPLDLLLLETDCPVVYGRETKYRSQPSDIIRSLKSAALLKNTVEIDVARQTTYNAARLFNIKIT